MSAIILSFVWHCVQKAHFNDLGPNTAYLDSGASHHMVADIDDFSTYSTNSRCKIELANGNSTLSPGKGFVYVKTESGGTLKLECLHVPEQVGYLISLGKLMRKGCVMVSTGEITSNLVRGEETMFKVKLNEQNILLIKMDVVKGEPDTQVTIL